MNKRLIAIFVIFFSLFFHRANASHIAGGNFSYVFVGDSEGYQKYQVTLTIYENCITGIPSVIAQDNPAYLGVYSAARPYLLLRADSVYFKTSASGPVTPNFSNSCISNIPPTCLLRKVFVMNYTFPPGTSGYLITWARCCRNPDVNNVVDPGDSGSTFYCYIPAAPLSNNSAVFKNVPPQIICENNPLVYDNSATDADGDSLSYGFVSSLNGGTGNNSKPWPGTPGSSPNAAWTGPPFDSTTYVPPFSGEDPMPGNPAISINPMTGLITGTPSSVGIFLVTVYCDEYRHSVWINRVTREFQFTVTPCSKVVVADMPQFSTDPNTYIVDCSNFTVSFVNTSKGGFAYHWDFGTGNPADTSDDFEPTFTYPDTGTFTVKLLVNPGTTCPDSISRFVKIYPYFRAAFADSGTQCPGAPISFIDQSTSTLKPIIYWKWSFGDGDSTFLENPMHSYQYSGIYNVILISNNNRDCADTVVKQIVIDNFSPFAGDDTIIVKGEKIQFNATGGIQYAWSPPTNLSDTNSYDPVGYYPDTGAFTYIVHITSPYGCQGYATVKVLVVNQATFVVPTAFTPNGDGLNDFFVPIAIGYKTLNYFRIFNRWGEEVYFSTSLETGWDGAYNGKHAEMGTYYWEISFTDRFGKNGTMKGDVELIR